MMPLDVLIGLRLALVSHQLLNVPGGLVANSYSSVKCKSAAVWSKAQIEKTCDKCGCFSLESGHNFMRINFDFYGAQRRLKELCTIGRKLTILY